MKPEFKCGKLSKHMSTDKETINSYNRSAGKWAKRLKCGKNIAISFLEKPAIYSKLNNLKGKTVLCLGCGTGEEAEYLRSLGAAEVFGIDIAEKLIEIAKKSFPKVKFSVMDIENLNFPPNTFDFVYSSLAMHYLPSWKKALKSISRVLKQDGIYLFSTSHPIYRSAQVIEDNQQDIKILGFKKYTGTNNVDIYGDYLNAKKIQDLWFGELKVTFHTRPLSSIFKDILNSDFELIDFLEPKASDKAKYKYPKFWKIHQKIPLFMIFELRKR